MALVQIPAPQAGGMVELASGSLSGTSVSLTSISGGYKDLVLVMRNISMSSNACPRVGVNSLSSGNAAGSNFLYYGTSPTATYDFINPFANRNLDASAANGSMYVTFNDYAATSAWKTYSAYGAGIDVSAGGLTYGIIFGKLDINSAVTSIQMMASAGAFDSGTYILYGVS